MTGLFEKPIRIDRAGSSSQQHFGNTLKIAQYPYHGPSKEPQGAPPPTRIYLGDMAPRILAQGKLSAPNLPSGVKAAIERDITNAAETLRYELEAVKVEADFVSGPTLRVEPDLYKSISVVGPYMVPQQIRSVIVNDTIKIEAQATRLLSGAASSYLPPAARGILQTVVADAKALNNYVSQQDLELLVGANIKLAQDHTETHVKAVREVIDGTEKQITGAEAQAVPVVEPSELNVGPLVAFGTLAVVAAILVVTL